MTSDEAAAIDELCDAFESAWKSAAQPDLAAVISVAPKSLRLPLAQQLVILDDEYRRRNNCPLLSLVEYAQLLGVDQHDLQSASDTRTISFDGLPTPLTTDGVFSRVFVPQTSWPTERFDVIGEIGRGGMGVVYKAWQPELRRYVALKTILPTILSSETRSRFQREAAAAGSLNHPGVVSVYEFGTSNDTPWMSMAWIDGENLSQHLQRGPIPIRRIVEMIRDVAIALSYAHSCGVIHRDLKPSNLLIDSAGIIRITDFGLARIAGTEESMTSTGDIIGSAAYMSPELALGRATEAGPLSDVYSLGAVLYRCLTGYAPFRTTAPTELLRQIIEVAPVSATLLNPEIPDELNTLCLKCLEKKPSQRYSSAADLAAELTRFLQGEPILARPVGRITKWYRWSLRHPAIVFSLAMTFALIMLILIGVPIVLIERAERQLAVDVARANAAQVAAKEYFATIAEVREKRTRRPAGWTWDALNTLQTISRLSVEGRDSTELRSLALGALIARDGRVIQKFAEGIDAEDNALSPDGKLLALAEVRRGDVCSVYLFRIEHTPTFRVLDVPWRIFSIYAKDTIVDGILHKAHGHLGEVEEGFSEVCFSNDGKRIAVATRVGHILEWDIESPSGSAPVVDVNTGDSLITQLEYSPDDSGWIFIQKTAAGQRLTIGKIHFWDRESRTRKWITDRRYAVFAVKGLGELIAGNDEGLWHVSYSETPQETWISTHKTEGITGVNGLSLSSDGSFIMACISSQPNGRYDVALDASGSELTFPFSAPRRGFATSRYWCFDATNSTAVMSRDNLPLLVADSVSGEAFSEIPISDFRSAGPLVILKTGHHFVASGNSRSYLLELRTPDPLQSINNGAKQPEDLSGVKSLTVGGAIISDFDINDDGDQLVISEFAALNDYRRRFRCVSLPEGTEIRRWTTRLLQTNRPLLNDTRWTFASFMTNGDIWACSPCTGGMLQLNDDGFQSVSGLNLIKSVAGTASVGADGIVFDFPAISSEDMTRSAYHPSCSLKLPRSFPRGDEELIVDVSIGDQVSQYSMTLKNCDQESPGWLLYRVPHRVAGDLLKEGNIRLKVRLRSPDLRLVAAESENADSFSVVAGQAFLNSNPHDLVNQCYMGPICRTPSGHVYGIDDETFLNRWTDASAEPELNWRDPISDFPQLRDLVSAGNTVLCSTRAGQVFRVLDDGTALHLTSGDRDVTEWDTERDMVKLAISRNERFAAGGTKNGMIAIFDLSRTSGFEIDRVQRHSVEVSALAFNHDATLLASGDSAGTFRLWRHQNGKLELLLETDYLMNPPMKMRFMPHQNTLYLLCMNERGLRVFDFDRLNAVYQDMNIGW